MELPHSERSLRGMGRLGRWFGVFALAAAVPAVGGCVFAHKPHAGDPLLKNGRGVWGDLEQARTRPFTPGPEPNAPHPPRLPEHANTWDE